MTHYDFTSTEVEALAEAFPGWTWDESSVEPDARVTILIEEPTTTPGFLFRHRDGWLRARDAKQAADRAHIPSSVSWKHSIEGIDGQLRLPTAEELVAGGWTIEKVDETEEKLPFATEQLLNAADLLEKGENEQLSLPEIMEAQASALASIAASVHDLTALIEEELAWRRSQRPARGTDVEEGEDTASAKEKPAHRSLGPTEDPDFSYTGR